MLMSSFAKELKILRTHVNKDFLLFNVIFAESYISSNSLFSNSNLLIASIRRSRTMVPEKMIKKFKKIKNLRKCNYFFLIIADIKILKNIPLHLEAMR